MQHCHVYNFRHFRFLDILTLIFQQHTIHRLTKAENNSYAELTSTPCSWSRHQRLPFHMIMLSSVNTDVYLIRVLGLLGLHRYNKDNTIIGLLLHNKDRQEIRQGRVRYQSGDIPSGLDVTCRASLRG
uniref:Secreted protein n=1 Tax=Heterorhabditis bacteriophora TaxID=37862 RepID=A0A1I7W6N4_HETBA